MLQEALRLCVPASTARYAPPGTVVTDSEGRQWDVGSSYIYIPGFLPHTDPEVG
jgi:hypothetical protein